MSKKKALICTLHDDIIETAEALALFDFIPGQKTKAKKLIKNIILAAEEAKCDGQDMEDRLEEYYTAITDLGFKRVKK